MGHCRYWNSVVNPSDSSSSSNRQSEEEAIQFHTFCTALDLRDAREVARRREGPRYTRAQVREGKSCWSRLDRLYISEHQVRKVVHHAQFCSSDHLPVSITLELDVRPEQGEEKRLSAYFKADSMVVAENLEILKEVWQKVEGENQSANPAERFLRCWAALRKQIKQLQYEKCAHLDQLPEKERRLQALMDKDPKILMAEEKNHLGVLLSEVRALQAWKHRRWRQTCRDRFFREGDACIAFFFKKFKQRKSRTTIRKLLKEDGQVLTSKEEIKKEVYTHFSAVYSAVEQTPNGLASKRSLLANVTIRLSAQERTLLDETPGENELLETLHLLPAGKSPGPDGITKEVMIVLWPMVRKAFCDAVLHFWESGNLLPYFKDGLLFLLPKVDNPLRLTQCRPITLLNTIYKMIAKLLAVRIAVVLPSKVPVEQQGFLKGRSTHNCILTFALLHETLKRERKSALFFSLDQEKAYDRLDPWKKKKALVCWELLVAPECWGGLGLPRIREFQQAFIVRTFFKAMKDPTQSLWLPIFSSAFCRGALQEVSDLFCFPLIPTALKQCPVASLLVESCTQFLSLFRWRPDKVFIGPEDNNLQSCFLLVMRFLDVADAMKVTVVIASEAEAAGIHSLRQLQLFMSSNALPDWLAGNPIILSILGELQHATLLQDRPTFSSSEWKGPSGREMNPSAKASEIYLDLIADLEEAQVERYNKKWDLQ
ncbi:hypothetical protein R1sor_021357 [Riccia sorocarpa]|uniref:Reverse transcriptase domain-containing protein n=1 Tax=Riccia sorocarpa TaxID=122646 RepID=A0ABD3GKK3_9MARC